MNDRDAIKSRSVLTLKSILFLLCYTASQNIFDYAKLMINVIYLMYIHTFISVILVIARQAVIGMMITSLQMMKHL